MDGDRRVQWGPLRSTWDKSFVSEEPTRRAFAIPCPQRRCTRCTIWEFRSDYDKLQLLLAKIVSDVSPCAVCGKAFAVTTVRSDQLIVMTLEQLRDTSKHAKGHYHLRA